MKVLGSILLLIGLGTFAFAQEVAPGQVPEVSPATAVNAVCLIAGAALVVRGRRKQ